MTTPPTVNLPPRVRLVLYIVTAVGSALVAYAVARGWIGDAEVALWAALTTIPNVLAAANVRRRERPAAPRMEFHLTAEQVAALERGCRVGDDLDGGDSTPV